MGIAVRKNKIEIVTALIERGADVDHYVKDLSILDLAILPGYFEIANLLYCKSKKREIK